jgi:hypothetical protein
MILITVPIIATKCLVPLLYSGGPRLFLGPVTDYPDLDFSWYSRVPPVTRIWPTFSKDKLKSEPWPSRLRIDKKNLLPEVQSETIYN